MAIFFLYLLFSSRIYCIIPKLYFVCTGKLTRLQLTLNQKAAGLLFLFLVSLIACFSVRFEMK